MEYLTAGTAAAATAAGTALARRGLAATLKQRQLSNLGSGHKVLLNKMEQRTARRRVLCNSDHAAIGEPHILIVAGCDFTLWL